MVESPKALKIHRWRGLRECESVAKTGLSLIGLKARLFSLEHLVHEEITSCPFRTPSFVRVFLILSCEIRERSEVRVTLRHERHLEVPRSELGDTDFELTLLPLLLSLELRRRIVPLYEMLFDTRAHNVPMSLLSIREWRLEAGGAANEEQSRLALL